MAILYGESHYQAWGEILGVVKTGKSGFELKFGQGVFQYLSQNPEEAKCFHQAMSEKAKLPIKSILENYSFSNIGSIVDIGGGDGSLLFAVLEQYSNIKGIVFDLPTIEEKVNFAIEERSLSDRCDFVSGDFFKEVPDNVDIYLMKSVLHDWSDEEAIKILKACSQAMDVSSRLLIIEALPFNRNAFDYAKMLDIQMLVNTSGRERSIDEFEDLCSDSGLKLSKSIPTSTEFSILECELIH